MRLKIGQEVRQRPLEQAGYERDTAIVDRGHVTLDVEGSRRAEIPVLRQPCKSVEAEEAAVGVGVLPRPISYALALPDAEFEIVDWPIADPSYDVVEHLEAPVIERRRCVRPGKIQEQRVPVELVDKAAIAGKQCASEE